MRRVRDGGVVAVWCALALAACTSDNSLSGSLEDVYLLQFDVVRARLYSSELAIEYVVSKSEAVPVRVTLNRELLREDGKTLAAGESYSLTQYGNITGRQADGTELFGFSKGKLQLAAFEAKQDAEIRGRFDAKFRAGDDVFSLSGDFAAELEQVPEPNLP